MRIGIGIGHRPDADWDVWQIVYATSAMVAPALGAVTQSASGHLGYATSAMVAPALGAVTQSASGHLGYATSAMAAPALGAVTQACNLDQSYNATSAMSAPALGAVTQSCTTAPFVPWDLANCVIALRADLGVTIGTGVSAWADQNGGTGVAQGVAGAQPAMSTWQGQDSILYDGTNDELTYSGAAADFKFLHDGTGATVYWAGAPGTDIGYVWDTNRSLSIANHGSGLWRHTDGRYRYYAGRGAAPLTWELTGAVANGTALYAVGRNATGAAPEAELRINGAVAASSAFAAAASASNPNSALRLGAYSGAPAGDFVNQELAEWGAFNARLAGNALTLLEWYLGARYGL